MENITKKEYKMFIGKKADYFLDKWQEANIGSGLRDDFNWAAFLLTGLWLPYRKMYRNTAILVAIAGFSAFIPFPKGSDIIFIILISGICGAYANRWYRNHVNKTISEFKSEGLSEEELEVKLRKSGGTSFVAPLLAIVSFVLSIILAALIISFVSRIVGTA